MDKWCNNDNVSQIDGHNYLNLLHLNLKFLLSLMYPIKILFNVFDGLILLKGKFYFISVQG